MKITISPKALADALATVKPLVSEKDAAKRPIAFFQVDADNTNNSMLSISSEALSRARITAQIPCEIADASCRRQHATAFTAHYKPLVTLTKLLKSAHQATFTLPDDIAPDETREATISYTADNSASGVILVAFSPFISGLDCGTPSCIADAAIPRKLFQELIESAALCLPKTGDLTDEALTHISFKALGTEKVEIIALNDWQCFAGTLNAPAALAKALGASGQALLPYGRELAAWLKGLPKTADTLGSTVLDNHVHFFGDNSIFTIKRGASDFPDYTAFLCKQETAHTVLEFDHNTMTTLLADLKPFTSKEGRAVCLAINPGQNSATLTAGLNNSAGKAVRGLPVNKHTGPLTKIYLPLANLLDILKRLSANSAGQICFEMTKNHAGDLAADPVFISTLTAPGAPAVNHGLFLLMPMLVKDDENDENAEESVEKAEAQETRAA